jgi:DNA processing protein
MGTIGDGGAGARVTRPGEARFPAALAEIPHPPSHIYWIGSAWPPPRRAVAVVGSRGASRYGLAVAAALAADLARAGVCVVSGMAQGIDAAAHRAALDAGGLTVAVLAAGAETAYPADMATLHGDIAAAGAVCAEYPAGTALRPGLFVRRNRLVSGLALGVVVVEAGPAGGALSTARAAIRQGRFVAAVPGDVTRENARGTLALLRDGAVPVGDAGHVLALLDNAGDDGLVLPPEAPDAVLRELREGALSADALAARLGRSPAGVSAVLVSLEMAGAVHRLAGGLYARRARAQR